MRTLLIPFFAACSSASAPHDTGRSDSAATDTTDRPTAPFPATLPVVSVTQKITATITDGEAVGVSDVPTPLPFDLPPASSDWSFGYFTHDTYACSRSGQQSFVLLNPPGHEWEEPLDLFVYLHGGGIGAFDPTGVYHPEALSDGEPCESMVDEEDPEKLFNRWSGSNVCSAVWPPDVGIAAPVVEAADQRILIVSKCDQDTYGGEGTPDLDNPWNPDNEVDGLLATMAAIETVFAIGATDEDHALTMAGASAGGVGVLTVSRALRNTGRTVHGVISDGAVMTDVLDDVYASAPSGCAFLDQVADPADWRPRLGRVADSEQQPHRLLTGDSTPVYLSYSPEDSTFCSGEAAEAVFADMAAAVEAVDPGGVSVVRRTCLDDEHGCNAHALVRWVAPGVRNTESCEGGDCEVVLDHMWTWLENRRADAHATGR